MGSRLIENAYLNLLFRDIEFGRAFLSRCMSFFHSVDDFEFTVEDYGAGVLGTLGPILSVYASSIAYHLPVTLDWMCETIEAIRRVWRRFSLLLDRYDAKGDYTLSVADLEKHTPDITQIEPYALPPALQEVYDRLANSP